MKVNQFEELIAWQKSFALAKLVYASFKDLKDFGFKDQIQRASISIMNNIAEGFERRGDKEFSHFLFIAKGSAAEVRSMLYVAKDLRYISESGYLEMTNNVIEISKITSALIKSIHT